MNNRKVMYILVGVIAVAVFVTFILILRNIGGTTASKVTLQFWGVYDDPSAFEKVISGFQAEHPEIDVKYRVIPYDQYETTMVNALAAGNGPDIVMIHNTWLPKHGDKLEPMPTSIPGQKEPLFTLQDYKNQFVDVVPQDLTYQNQIYGVPLYVDTLALYYNKDLFNAAGITTPPKMWEDVNNDIQLLTKFDSRGNITQSAAALGTARNINRSTDILMDMMLQSGVNMTSSDNRTATFAEPVSGQHVGEIALEYYTDFANPRKQSYAWNSSLHYSVDAFSEGTLAMMFNYSHQAAAIRAKAPRLNFGIAPMPQASATDIRDFANYWAAAVTKGSAHPNEAWEFLAYLGSKDGESAYLAATGRPAARRDLIDLQKSDPDLSVFARQALTARSWYQVDNVAIENIFADMIDDVNFNRATVPAALGAAETKINVLMRQ
ncbi:MAG TPA: extracellular solute-binding protein [Candidatus Paceibacterota bacterium]|nr:extracellular solute-binding protein [Candidatus Paceibacterota bacterium]